MITDDEYPKLVAQQVLSKIADEFLAKYPRSAFTNASANSLPYPELKTYITKYQDPQQADSIMKIQKELDETKIVLHDTINAVLQRGEKIDDLVAKSDGLSAQSKMFYTQVCTFECEDTQDTKTYPLHRQRSRTHAATSCRYVIAISSLFIQHQQMPVKYPTAQCPLIRLSLQD